jgi:tRNA A-37 threonylcarbamoyl transferase component Bud32
MEYVFENKQLINRDQLLKEFTFFTHNLHENGIMFLDHSTSNTLIKKNNNGYKFYLIDLNRMRFKSLTLKERLKNFKRLKMNDEVLKKVSEYYADLIKIDKQLIFKSIKKYSENFENNRIIRKRLKFFFRI